MGSILKKSCLFIHLCIYLGGKYWSLTVSGEDGPGVAEDGEDAQTRGRFWEQDL